MYKIVSALIVTVSIAGCATAPRDKVVGVVATSPAPAQRVVATQTAPMAQAKPQVQQARPAVTATPKSTPAPKTSTRPTPDADLARLKPGAAYIASFPEDERRAACLRLDYEEGTGKFLRCLEGDFPENPYFGG
jgi:pyruvate/2-oxoglutarate dehydrogenase complex dihydrolipoamide acyltransferase (E2) component